MTLPGMRERTMRIGSAGKTFSLTGWKVGYVTAAATLTSLVRKAHQNLTFTTAPNLQRAVAVGLGKDDAYFAALSPRFAGAARSDGRRPGGGRASDVLPTSGSYFITTDFTPLRFNGDDVAFCRHITEHAGVTAIPVSAFYDEPRRAEPLRPLRLLQAPRGPGRGARPAEAAFPRPGSIT